MSNLKDNLKQLQQYEKEIKNARNKAVYTGLPKDKTNKAYADGGSVIAVGAAHEFGFGNIPARSFLRVPFKQNEQRIKKFINKQFGLLFDGDTTADKALNQIGILTRNISVDSFDNNNWAALSEETIKRKGSAKPLVDTGNLRQSITWSVR